jgi:integrase
MGKAHKENPTRVKAIPAFEPYCLRHTALTRLADAGCDAFTLAKIAGHGSIGITIRYCHPQAEAVERAFNKLGQDLKTPPAGSSIVQVGKKLGTVEKEATAR